MKRRICIFILSFIVIYLVTFAVPRLMPGDPFEYSASDAAENVDVSLTREQKEIMRAYYGLDRSVGEQLLNTIQANLRGDFGQSIHYKRAAADVIVDRLPWTLLIMGTTLILSLIAGVFLALVGVRRPRMDRFIYGGSSLLSEVPAYLIGVLLLFLVAAKVDWIPLSGAQTAFARYGSVWEQVGDIAVHAMLPVTALCLYTIPKFYFTARASFLSVREKLYLLGAKSRGVTERRVRWRYIFVNGITPVLARLFLSVGGTIGGTILVENVFAYPGLGTVMREAVKYRDYIMIQDVFLLSAVLVLVSMFLADWLNSFVDRKEGLR